MVYNYGMLKYNNRSSIPPLLLIPTDKHKIIILYII
jgi:hypothetical protein